MQLHHHVRQISDDMKLLGKRSAGNRHATFDEEGGGNMIERLMRHCSTLRS